VLSLDNGKNGLEAVASTPKFTVKCDRWQHLFPLFRSVQLVTVSCEHSCSVPVTPNTVKFFTHQPTCGIVSLLIVRLCKHYVKLATFGLNNTIIRFGCLFKELSVFTGSIIGSKWSLNFKVGLIRPTEFIYLLRLLLDFSLLSSGHSLLNRLYILFRPFTNHFFN